MTNKKDVNDLVETFVAAERITESNPFLSTRIMEAIEKENTLNTNLDSPVWKSLVIGASMGIAIFAGIMAGSLYQTENNRAVIVLDNDDRMENFSLLNNIGNEK